MIPMSCGFDLTHDKGEGAGNLGAEPPPKNPKPKPGPNISFNLNFEINDDLETYSECSEIQQDLEDRIKAIN